MRCLVICAENELNMSSMQAFAPVHVRFRFAFVLVVWVKHGFFSSGLHAISVFVLNMGLKQASPFRVHVKTLVSCADREKQASVFSK